MIVKTAGPKLAISEDIKINKGTSGSNAAVAITKTAPTDAYSRWVLDGVQWSYAGGTVTGKLTITDGVTDIFEVDITATGPGGYQFHLPATAGAAMVITLGAGGASVVGKINVQCHQESA